MELLNKKEKRNTDELLDSSVTSDRLPLFPKGVRIDSAQTHRSHWDGINDQRLRENISYQMQYLEFQVKLYNTYEMYLTLESLHLKNIRATVSNIIEASLYNLVDQAWQVANYEADEGISFFDLIDEAYDMKLIDEALRGELHQLRKHRNKIHFRSLEYKEYSAYEVDEINQSIKTLNLFIETTQPETKPNIIAEEI